MEKRLNGPCNRRDFTAYSSQFLRGENKEEDQDVSGRVLELT